MICADSIFVCRCYLCSVSCCIVVIGYPYAPRENEPTGFVHKLCIFYSSKYGHGHVSALLSVRSFPRWAAYTSQPLTRKFRELNSERTKVMNDAPAKCLSQISNLQTRDPLAQSFRWERLCVIGREKKVWGTRLWRRSQSESLVTGSANWSFSAIFPFLFLCYLHLFEPTLTFVQKFKSRP